VARGPHRRQLLVAGHVNVDHFVSVDAFPAADRTVPILAEREELGGTATTVARSAREHGVSVGLLARVGDGFPPAFRATLAREGIDLRGLTAVGGVPTPRCTIVEDRTGRSRTFIQQGPMGASRPAPLPGAWWTEYRWLHLGTGEPTYYLRLARAARAAGMRVALDPAQEILYRWDRPTFVAVAPLAEILFGNRAEIERAALWAGRGRMASLLGLVPLVVRTDGARGATAFFRGGTLHVAGRRPRRRRTLVGAGDAFRGGFYGAWFEGRALADCVDAGNRAAVARIEGSA
jgi:nucleoside kinase